MGLLLQGLAMLRDIEAFHLLPPGNPERQEDADQPEQGVGHAADQTRVTAMP
jgi:hypothetical protein